MGEGGADVVLDGVSFATAFESLPDPMVIVDEAGTIVAVNGQALALLGYGPDELVGQPVELLVPDDRRERHEAHRTSYLATPSTRPMGGGLDLAVRCQDGSTIPADISLRPLALGAGRMVLVALRDMTSQRAAEEALAAFAFIVQSSDDVIYQVDRDGRISSWNPGAARVTGYAEADVVGQEPDFLFPDHRRAEEAEALRRALKGERIERRETELRRRYGLMVPVELTVSPLRDRGGQSVGASVIAHDITEQRLAQQYLAESQTRLREAQELARVGMWTWDRETDVVQYSEPLFGMFDVDPASFQGTFAELIDQVVVDDRERIGSALRRAASSGDAVSLECGVLRGRLGRGWVSVRSEAVLNSGGAVVGLRGIVQDLTDRHVAELAVRDALALERQASKQLREADRVKDEFLSTVSHELRTPLTAIVGLSSVLAGREELDDTAPDLIARVLRNAQEMSGMIERLLDFSRLEAGRVVLHPQDLALAGAVGQCLEFAEAALAEHVIECDVAADLVVHIDPDALTRVLVNLLTNAAKFSPPGSTVHIAGRAEHEELVISVRDEGRGMDRATADRVFERFFQVESDQRPGKRGAGIGLAIVQRYVEMCGGRVWVDTAIAQGTTVSFAVPLQVGSPR
ncbi:MAG: PAS domain S-box protein [Acidimicrobiales bacterium]